MMNLYHQTSTGAGANKMDKTQKVMEPK